MMFEYAFGLKREGSAIRKAVSESIDCGFVTEDLASLGSRPLSTSEVGDKVAELIENDN